VDADDEASPPRRTLELRIAIEPGELLSGTIVIADDVRSASPFRGWIELMALIDAAREPGRRTTSAHPER
jgi:hypothetical protein